MPGGRVVVLGPTGRNFAAGMSGGVAYVLDDERSGDEASGRGRETFAARCNMGLVGFEEIEESEAIELHELIEEHHLRTQSPIAARILREWADYLPRFKKVMPHDYKRALRELAEAEAADELRPAERVSS
jgi:glutamate synthase domain-containing protein 3